MYVWYTCLYFIQFYKNSVTCSNITFTFDARSNLYLAGNLVVQNTNISIRAPPPPAPPPRQLSSWLRFRSTIAQPMATVELRS